MTFLPPKKRNSGQSVGATYLTAILKMTQMSARFAGCVAELQQQKIEKNSFVAIWGISNLLQSGETSAVQMTKRSLSSPAAHSRLGLVPKRLRISSHFYMIWYECRQMQCRRITWTEQNNNNNNNDNNNNKVWLTGCRFIRLIVCGRETHGWGEVTSVADARLNN